MRTSVTYDSGRIIGLKYKHLIGPHERVIEPSLIFGKFDTEGLNADVVPAIVACAITVYDGLKQVDLLDATCVANGERVIVDERAQAPPKIERNGPYR